MTFRVAFMNLQLYLLNRNRQDLFAPQHRSPVNNTTDKLKMLILCTGNERFLQFAARYQIRVQGGEGVSLNHDTVPGPVQTGHGNSRGAGDHDHGVVPGLVAEPHAHCQKRQ